MLAGLKAHFRTEDFLQLILDGFPKWLARIMVVCLVISPWLITGPIPGCLGIAVWSKATDISIPSCLAENPGDLSLLVILNIYGFVFPVGIAIGALAILAIADKNHVLRVAAITMVVGLFAYLTSNVGQDGRVLFDTLIIATGVLLIFLATLFAPWIRSISAWTTLRRKSSATAFYTQKNSHLTPFAYAFVSGIFGVAIADFAHMNDEIAAGVNLIHVGGDDVSDIVFLAGWFASICFIAVSAFTIIPSVIRLINSRMLPHLSRRP